MSWMAEHGADMNKKSLSNEYTKEIYKLKNKSKDGIQHFGYNILKNGDKFIRQWHKPKVNGHVFMTEIEANQEADNIIVSLLNTNK